MLVGDGVMAPTGDVEIKLHLGTPVVRRIRVGGEGILDLVGEFCERLAPGVGRNTKTLIDTLDLRIQRLQSREVFHSPRLIRNTPSIEGDPASADPLAFVVEQVRAGDVVEDALIPNALLGDERALFDAL